MGNNVQSTKKIVGQEIISNQAMSNKQFNLSQQKVL